MTVISAQLSTRFDIRTAYPKQQAATNIWRREAEGRHGGSERRDKEKNYRERAFEYIDNRFDEKDVKISQKMPVDRTTLGLGLELGRPFHFFTSSGSTGININAPPAHRHRCPRMVTFATVHPSDLFWDRFCLARALEPNNATLFRLELYGP